MAAGNNCGDYYEKLNDLQAEARAIQAEEAAARAAHENMMKGLAELAKALDQMNPALGGAEFALKLETVSYSDYFGVDGSRAKAPDDFGIGGNHAASRLVNRQIQAKPGELKTRIDNITRDLGGDGVADLVAAGFNGRVGPRGRIGAMVNYRQYKPSEENMAKLAELLGIQRIGTPAGQEIAKVFGADQARAAFKNLIKEAGGDPLEVARNLGKDAGILNELPVLVSSIRKARWDSQAQFLDAIEATVPYVEKGEIVPTPMLTEMYTAGRWATYFEQMDALSSRRIGQALRSLNFSSMREFDPVMALRGESKMQLTLDDIEGNTMLGQLMQSIDNGDALKLKKMLVLGRTSAFAEIDMFDGNWLHTDYHILNIFRRDNWLSSIKSWLFRNPISNIGMYGHGLLEQTAAKTFKYGTKNAVKGVMAGHELSWGNWGMKEAWQALPLKRFLTGTNEGVNLGAFKSSAHQEAAQAVASANAEMLRAWGTHWNHFSEYWKNGNGGKFGDPAKLQDLTMTADKEAQMVDALDKMFSEEGRGMVLQGNPLRYPSAAMLGMQHAFHRVLKDVMGLPYMPSLRVNGATDEAFRSMMVQQRVYSDAWFKALDELGPEALAEELDTRASEIVSGLMIRGDLSADDIGKMRRELDVPLRNPGKDLTDSKLMEIRKERNISKDQMNDTALRERIVDERLAKYWSDTYGGSLDINQQIARDAIEGADRQTFTGSMRNPALQGIGLARRAEWVAYQLPFFKVPMNSTFFNLNYSVGSFKEGTELLVDEFGKRFLNKTISRMTPDEIASAKAKITVAGMYFGSWSILSAANNFDGLGPLINGGLSRDRESYANERRNKVPYSIRIPFTRTFIPLGGIDPFDILFLYQDFHELHQEANLSTEEYNFWTEGILLALARTFQRKASLLTTIYAVDAFMNPDKRNPWDTLMQHVSGFVPAAGLVGNVASAVNVPGASFLQTQPLSVDERKALDKPLDAFMSKAKDTVLRLQMRIPGVNTTLPIKQDWLGSKLERPLGMPIDAFVPFAPVVLPQDQLYLWLEKVDGLTPPRANGRFGNFKPSVGIPEFGTLTAQGRELEIYYEKLSTAKGSTGQAAALGYPDIAKYVEGKTAYQALNALRLDPRVQQEIAKPSDGKPSFDKSISKASRAERVNTSVGQLVDDIKNYYDVLGFDGLMKDDDPAAQEFQGRYRRMVEYTTGRATEGLKNQLMLGVGRQ